MNKHILIVRKYTGYGGIEQQITNITIGLTGKGWSVHFLSDCDSPLSAKLQNIGAQVHIFPFGSTVAVGREICRICKENEIGIIQSHMLKESFYCRVAKAMMPSLKHVFRVHTYIDCAHIPEFKKKCYHAASKLTDFLVDRYVSINEYNIRELRSRTKLSPKKLTVVHNAVRELEQPLSVCPYKNGSLAMIANFVDFKGHDVLLDGMRILKEQGHTLQVHLIGSVPGYNTPNEDHKRLDIIKKTIRDYHLEESVILDGYSSNIAQSIADCGMVVLPSDSEGTPNVLLEGMLLKKIVVASAVGGVPEFVLDGKTGFIHQPKDAEDFARAILRAYETPDERLAEIAENARKMVLNDYSKQSLIQGLEDVYDHLGAFS